MSPDGEDLIEHLTKKYGRERAAQFTAPGNPLQRAGELAGIYFNSNRRVIPTEKCHIIIEYLNQHLPEKSNDFMEGLFRQYFEEGKDVSQQDILLQVARDCEVEPHSIDNALQSSKYLDDVISKTDYIQKNMKVRGVPYFIIKSQQGGRPITFSGAQPIDIMIEALQMAL
mmetsp:Transcript_2263/g.2360  ORF Transcript_2263/g.2360 Transcript_2263/m.2360 type:complete len:170 (+) Transcript_2263:225-734(+)